MTMSRSASNKILILALLMLVVGVIGMVSPWTYDIYIWMYPEEQFAYSDNTAGGPYPELGFLFLIFPAAVLAAIGIHFRDPKGEAMRNDHA